MSETEKIELLIKGIHTLRILLAWEAGELSEGQAVAALGVNRVEARTLKADAVAAGVKAHDEIKAALSIVNGAQI